MADKPISQIPNTLLHCWPNKWNICGLQSRYRFWYYVRLYVRYQTFMLSSYFKLILINYRNAENCILMAKHFIKCCSGNCCCCSMLHSVVCVIYFFWMTKQSLRYRSIFMVRPEAMPWYICVYVQFQLSYKKNYCRGSWTNLQ